MGQERTSRRASSHSSLSRGQKERLKKRNNQKRRKPRRRRNRRPTPTPRKISEILIILLAFSAKKKHMPGFLVCRDAIFILWRHRCACQCKFT